MTHLLDTHAWIQIALGDTLPALVKRTLTEHATTLASADISLWEAAKLVELGRLELSVSLAEFFDRALAPELKVLPVTPAIAARVTTLEATGFHKDPADQFITATALEHNLRLLSDAPPASANGPAFPCSGAPRKGRHPRRSHAPGPHASPFTIPHSPYPGAIPSDFSRPS